MNRKYKSDPYLFVPPLKKQAGQKKEKSSNRSSVLGEVFVGLFLNPFVTPQLIIIGIWLYGVLTGKLH